jgi:hypothetical protein
MTRSASLIPEGSTMRGVGTAGANPLAPTIPTNRTRELRPECFDEAVSFRLRRQSDRVVGDPEYIDSVEDCLRERISSLALGLRSSAASPATVEAVIWSSS